MKLNLVISNPAQLLHGYLPSHRFGPQGGSIGSAALNLRDTHAEAIVSRTGAPA